MEPLRCLEGGSWSRSIPTCTHLCDLTACPFAKKCEIMNSVATCICRVLSDCEDSSLSVSSRVCGSNGKTYLSYCHLEVESCQNENQNIVFVHDGTCVIGTGCSTVPIDKYTAMEENIDVEFGKYFVNNRSCVLTPYNYGVPMGTGFVDKSECDRECIHENFCLLPRDAGICNNHLQRWAYDAVRRVCVQFDYSGCGGNQNNFITKYHCAQTCPDRCPACERKMSLSESCCAQKTILLVKITRLNRFPTRTIFTMTVLNGTVPVAWESLRVNDLDDTYSVMSTTLLYRDDPCICPRLMALDTTFLIIVDTDNPQLEENTFAEPWTAKLQSEFLATKACSGYISMLEFDNGQYDFCPPVPN
ncbi:Protein AMBP [Holothuria leucospilota]|uniref:Protein AMBP n=1 Tax=Holothuria leucospilota TaxID=206669 RepID=A0A9Q1C5Y6_HOLLE|nr:Protein AMBP [Holothuria leucospilota]